MELVSPSELNAWDQPGPRYTSYPTVPEWGPLAPSSVEQALGCARPPAQVYVHVPFCAEQCSFCGCNMVVAGRREIGQKYLDNLRQQVQSLPLPQERIPVQRIHLGGGTPTWFMPEELQELHRILMERFTPTDDAEISIEADPQITTFEHLDALNAVGFNRLSLGVQSFDPVVLQAVNRPQWRSRIGEILDHARGLGWWGLNLDLIYGLPHQTPERFGATLKQAIELKPDRFAVFGYAHVPWLKKHQRGIERHERPDADQRLRLYLQARDQLEAAGYVTIRLDHFARPEDALARAWQDGSLHRNFMGYTTQRGLDLLAGGVSGISLVNGAYLANEGDVDAWRKQIGQGKLPWRRGLLMAGDDALRGDVIESVMCQFQVDKRLIESGHDISFDDYFADARQALAPLRDDGLVEEDDNTIRVTEDGRLFVRNVAMVFDRYLGDGEGRFSQTV